MKRYVRALPVLLLLAGCRAQPPMPTPEPTPVPEVSGALEAASVGIEVDIGDGAHAFWVELAEAEVGKTVNIYREKGDPKPFQSFTDEEAMLDLEMAELTAEDVNFDGCMDFHYCTGTGYALVSHSSYYVWDPNTEQFQADPYGLNELSTAEFLPYSGEVSSLSQGPMGRLITSYQYEGDTLIRVGECFFPETVSTERAYTSHRIVVDEKHTFWVEVCEREKAEEGKGTPVLVSVFDGDGELYQTFEDDIWLYGLDGVTPYATDVDFDGHMDFGYLSWSGGSYAGSAYYIWDPTAEQFVRDPYGLEDLPLPKFDPEKQIIETWSHSASNYTIEFYRYLDGELTCVRRLKNWENDTDDYTATLTVEEYDRETGALKEVYREEQAEIGGVTYATTDEFRRWHDIDYPGE